MVVLFMQAIFFCFISVRKPSTHLRRKPSRYAVYWDMNIPTEYYEQEFLDFENDNKFTELYKPARFDHLHGESEFRLHLFKKFEQFQQNEDKMLRRQLKMNAIGERKQVCMTEEAMEHCTDRIDGVEDMDCKKTSQSTFKVSIEFTLSVILPGLCMNVFYFLFSCTVCISIIVFVSGEYGFLLQC